MTMNCYRVVLCLLIAGALLTHTVAADEPGVLPAASFTYTLATAGRVSAAVYSPEGRLLRELRRGELQEAGAHTLYWDGLNQAGASQPPGEYTWRVLCTPGFVAEYLTSIGTRPGSAPYDVWVGNHGGVAAIALDATGLYASATVTETAPVLLKQSLDGREQHWTRERGDVTRGRFQGGVALASDGRGRLYMLQQNAYLQVIDAATGTRVASWDLLPPGQTRNKEESDQFYHHGESVAAVDLAAQGDTLVLSDQARELLFWLDPETGQVTAQRHIDAPAGVALAPDGRLFVISGTQVLAITRDGAVSTTIAAGLEAPTRLAYDPAGPSLLVVEGGTRQQIHRYALDGTRLASYGRSGGRRDGHYVATDFLQVTAIAADETGGFVICEQEPAPRRVAHFDREGALINEWYGGQPYYAWGEPDPRTPTRVWFNPGSWLTLAEIDPVAKSWRVLENYRQDRLAGGLMQPVTGHAGRWRVLYQDDRCYLVSESVPQVLLYEPGRLQAVSVLGNQAEHVAQAAKFAGHAGAAKAFRWLDDNGDGTPQPGEFTFVVTNRIPGVRAVADNFELLGVHVESRDGQWYYGVTRTRPQWTEHGPRYPLGDEEGVNELACEARVPATIGTGGTRGVGAYRDSDGNYYALYNTGEDWHGAGWPTYWGGQSRLMQWGADGVERWRVGRHAIHGGLGTQPHTTPPGFIHVGAAISGEIRDTIMMVDRVEWMGMVWTKDGLYVGNVLDGRMDDGLPDTVYYWWRTPDGKESIITSDNATGSAIVEAADGSVYFFTQGRNSVPVYKIHGWDNWQRLAGTIQVTALPPYAASTGSGLTADYYEQRDIVNEPAAQQVDSRIWHGSPRGKPGNHEVIDGFTGGPTFDWSAQIAPLGRAAGDGFAVRWHGQLEAPLTEAFTFSVYTRGGARLWLDGRQLIFGWNEAAQRRESPPVALHAGQRYDIQLDFYSVDRYPAVSLNWESFTFDRQRIPTAYLYPQPAHPPVAPAARAATERVPADTFDGTNIEPENNGNSLYTSGLRHRGLAKKDAYLRYDRIDCGAGVTRLRVGGVSGRAAGNAQFAVTLEFRRDAPDGALLATLRLTPESATEQLIDLDAPLAGLQTIYVVNASPPQWHFVNLGWFQFE